jgi:hypothetical protein
MKEKRMNSAVPDLTPPGKPQKAPKAPKEAKAPKAEKAPVDPNAPKKERAPRTDYGFRPDAVIGIVEGKGDKYRGHRKDWFETVKAHAGQTVAQWVAATKKEGGDPPRGWLRFFVQDGSVTLTGGTDPAPKAAKTEEKPAAG